MRRSVALLAILLLFTGVSSCSRPSAFTARNAVVFVLDPLAAGGVGCYGAPDARTPFLDRLARSGGSFRTCVSASTDEAVAAATLLGGVQPWKHGVRKAGDAFRPVDPPLARLLSGGQLATAAFLDHPIDVDGLGLGFRTFETVGTADDDRGSRNAVAAAATAWIETLPDDATFLLFTLLPPDGDHGVGRIVRAMEATGHLRRTLLLATSLRDGSSELAAEVPLIAWGPFPFRGGILRPDLSCTADLLPTVLEGLRVGTTANRPGRALQIRKKPFREAKLNAYAETDDGRVRALRTLRWKYVEGPRATLFDLEADPAAGRDLASDAPELADSLRAVLIDLSADGAR